MIIAALRPYLSLDHTLIVILNVHADLLSPNEDINATPGDITLNDDPPSNPKLDPLWEEISILQDTGIKVLAMLGGAARGTFSRLDSEDEATFERFYGPLREVIRRYGFDGVDLDVEEEMSLAGIVRLVDRLRRDFKPGSEGGGRGFDITMAPVATVCEGKSLGGRGWVM